MSDLGEALTGAVALIIGGFIFLLFASTFGSTGLLNFGLWGLIFIVLGVLGAVTLAGIVAGFLLEGGR